MSDEEHTDGEETVKIVVRSNKRPTPDDEPIECDTIVRLHSIFFHWLTASALTQSYSSARKETAVRARTSPRTEGAEQFKRTATFPGSRYH